MGSMRQVPDETAALVALLRRGDRAGPTVAAEVEEAGSALAVLHRLETGQADLLAAETAADELATGELAQVTRSRNADILAADPFVISGRSCGPIDTA